MARVGYARVSTRDQSLDIQLSKLANCDRVYYDQLSGLDSSRPQLASCRQYLREGDTLVITRLDRLARSTLDLCRITEELDRKHVTLQVLDQAIDTSTSTGRLLFHVLAAIAEFETEIRRERQVEGIAKARLEGRYIRKPRPGKVPEEALPVIRMRRQDGESMARIARLYQCHPKTIYRFLATHEEKQ
jgi:DNA invertase Pin-like site-specific DNA recombinase